ncbi:MULTISPECIES: ComEC/Rec2 family competence protein [unclassified Bacteroides]|uniref:ComEC/Rec2 family competence protein n=1 Tax=unclassified Bacteroides TaxID=2646097 RepID=UPI000E89CF1F|nr:MULTISPECIES: MBL fold metallo-hydrolase [unclassified Bacteroides]RGN59245.1 MBL fold metallo-hydrolase [Bacteroides sp. OM05-10AA]RGQ65028.1 MBL fold metallo-hydrolase [Bacteroides sp. AF27-33]
MLHIEMLQALHGDAFILHCKKGKNEGVVVVDGGPTQDSFKIVKRLDMLGTIDLMVLTHYDDDHIGGILAYIKRHKDDKPFPVKEMWVNCAYQVPFKTSPNISMMQAKKLADELECINHDLIQSGHPAIRWRKPVIAGEEKHLPFADFQILSPFEYIKELNDANFKKEIANISRNNNRQKGDLEISLIELSRNNKKSPNETSKQEVVNWSSISFILNCDNYSALMLGDSYPCTIIDSLKRKGYNCDDRKLVVDYVKVSHHGSCNNISNEMLDMIECNKFLISTNGGTGRSCHPDRESIANIIYHTKRDKSKPIHFYFNYEKEKIEKKGFQFIKEGEEDECLFTIHDGIQLFP